jgi:hypothetical protein
MKSSLPYLSLREISRFEEEARRLDVSVVARSRQGFLPAYKRAGGDPKRLSLYWQRRRDGFVLRHMAQVRLHGESLFRKDGGLTRRHLALIMWAYSPGTARRDPGKKPNKRSSKRLCIICGKRPVVMTIDMIEEKRGPSYHKVILPACVSCASKPFSEDEETGETRENFVTQDGRKIVGYAHTWRSRLDGDPDRRKNKHRVLRVTRARRKLVRK